MIADPQQAANDAWYPRLPDDYEHPGHRGLVHVRDIRVDPRALAVLTKAKLSNFREILACEIGTSLRKPGLQAYRDRVRLELPDDAGGRQVFYLKRYVRPPWREQLRRIREASASHGSAWREVHFAKKLARLGIASLRPVAFGEEMQGAWERVSFAMMAEVKGESLESRAARAVRDPGARPSWRDRVEIIRQLALITRRLHDHRLFHRDLYLCHVFLGRNTDGKVVLTLIDLGRMREDPWNVRRWQIKDLASLDYSSPAGLVTRADRLRFLYYYGRDFARRGEIDRSVIRAVQARTWRMSRHDESRARRFERERTKDCAGASGGA